MAVGADVFKSMPILLANLSNMKQFGFSNICIWILDIALKYFVYAVGRVQC